MVAPIDYTTQVADPFAQALQGLKLGAGMAELEQNQALMAQQQQQRQLALQEQARFFTNPNPTMRDAARYASFLTPEQSKAFQPYMEGISKEQQQNFLKSTGRLLSLMQVNPETAANEMKTLAAASRNSGDESDASLYEQMAEAAINPEKKASVFISLAARAAGVPGSKEMFEAYSKASSTAQTEALFPDLQKQKEAEMRKAVSDADKAAVEAKYAEKAAIAKLEKEAADLGLTKAQTGSALAQTKKINTEIARAALELEALKASGGVDPEKKFAQEEKIRKEWQGRSKVYSELQGTFSNIQASSSAGTGAGDIALITGFMKMLDPGSVVRETEFATARDTAGLFTQLENRLQKAKDGQLLKPDQRQQYVTLAKQYLEAAQKKADQEKKDLGIVVKNYKLNPENVFGAERAPADVPVQVTLPDGRVATFQNQKAADDFKVKAGL